MTFRERLHRLLFGAEYKLSFERYQMYCAEVVRRKHLERQLADRNEAYRKLQTVWEHDRPKPARFERYRAMDEEQLAEVLAGAGELPAVRAIMQLIDEKFQQAFDEGSEAKLDANETKFHVGGADWLVKLKGEIQSALDQERVKETAR